MRGAETARAAKPRRTLLPTRFPTPPAPRVARRPRASHRAPRSRRGRSSGLGPARRPSEQQAVGPRVDHAHDHHRIGAGKVVGVAARAVTLVPGVDDLRGRAAVGTEAVAPVPGQQRRGVGGKGRFFCGQLRRRLAQPGRMAGPRLGTGHVGGKQRRAAAQAKKDPEPSAPASTRCPSSIHTPRSDSWTERALGSVRRAASQSTSARSWSTVEPRP